MYQVNEDNSIYVTRGDIVVLPVSAEDNGEPYTFQKDDLLRIKVYGKKDCTNVVLTKDFPVSEETQEVVLFLSKTDTKFGEVISKPKDYWYEVELNPDANAQTIICYFEDGPVLFRLFPEGDDEEAPEYVPDPETIKVMDDELDLTSERPVKNKAIARKVFGLEGKLDTLTIKPEAFGAKGDGVTDDTASIRAALEKCYISKSALKLTAGRTYLVSGIEITRPVTIDFDGAAFKRTPETESNYYTLKVSSDNVVLNNPHLIGDRNEHDGTDGEWGHCLYLTGNNIKVNNGFYEYAWGDGVYIFDGYDIALNGFHHMNKCSRNGLSIVKGERITVDTILAELTDRTLPMKAVDIECNNSTQQTKDIHINHIISKCNNGALDIVCRGNELTGITVGMVTSIGDLSNQVNFNYSEVNDDSDGIVNADGYVKIGQVLIDKATGNAVRFLRWNRTKCPRVSVDKVNVSEFTAGTATVDKGAVGLLVERNYDDFNEFGGFCVNLTADIINGGTLVACINNQSEVYKSASVLKDVTVNSASQWNVIPEISFPNAEGFVVDCKNYTNDTVNIMNGFNYLTSNTPTFRSWLTGFVIVCGVSHVDLMLHSSVDGKIYVNDEEYAGNRLFNMLNKIIYGYKDGNDIRLYFYQGSAVWATTNTTSQKNPIDGQTIFCVEKKKPLWYYGGTWYYADGSVYTP
jgi:hypothetical protein